MRVLFLLRIDWRDSVTWPRHYYFVFTVCVWCEYGCMQRSQRLTFRSGSHSVTVPKVQLSLLKIMLFLAYAFTTKPSHWLQRFFCFCFYIESISSRCVCVCLYMHICSCTYRHSGGQRTAFRVWSPLPPWVLGWIRIISVTHRVPLPAEPSRQSSSDL